MTQFTFGVYFQHKIKQNAILIWTEHSSLTVFGDVQIQGTGSGPFGRKHKEGFIESFY